MVEQDPLFTTKVKHQGVFNFKETYKVLYEWLRDEDYDVNEKTYKENVGAGGAKEIEIEWRALRKISDYFRFVIKANWHMLGMTEVEVEIDGVKQKMNKGQFEIKVTGILEKDWAGVWENKAFFKFLRTLYDRYLIQSRIEKYEGKLIGEVDEFVAQTKAFLSLTGKR